jgi:DNA-directed RNA polymerase specialized sigma24 family protein
MAELPKGLSKDRVHALLAEWAGGRDEALNEIFPHYSFKVVGILAEEDGINIEDAKDVVQQAFINLHERVRAGHKPPTKLTYYLVASARQQINYKRRYKLKNLPIDHGIDVHNDWSEALPASVRSLASTMGSIEKERTRYAW